MCIMRVEHRHDWYLGSCYEARPRSYVKIETLCRTALLDSCTWEVLFHPLILQTWVPVIKLKDPFRGRCFPTLNDLNLAMTRPMLSVLQNIDKITAHSTFRFKCQYYNISPSYSSSIYSREEYNTLKWGSESLFYRNSVHNHKKISPLKISGKACGLIFLLWEITCKKIPPYLLRNKCRVRPTPHALWHHGKSVYYLWTTRQPFYHTKRKYSHIRVWNLFNQTSQ